MYLFGASCLAASLFIAHFPISFFERKIVLRVLDPKGLNCKPLGSEVS
jgi:hypothetical protein